MTAPQRLRNLRRHTPRHLRLVVVTLAAAVAAQMLVAWVAAESVGAGAAAIGVVIATVAVMASIAALGPAGATARSTGEESPDPDDPLIRQAFHDALTGLPNRALFLDRLEHALGRLHREGRPLCVVLLDLDDFKTVNDSLGHIEGDLLIALVAERLMRAVRGEDTAARLGGDEFALLLEATDEDGAVYVARRVIDALSTSFELTDRSVRITASGGLALSSPTLASAKEMVRAADLAMYAAKAAGKDQYRLFEDGMLRATVERLRLGTDIRGAVERNELLLQYQPIVLIPSGTIVGMEALVRWTHPDRGLIGPSDFIPLAEATGAIVPLGEFVLRDACRQARTWLDVRPGQTPVVVNVNVSGVQLQQSTFVSVVRDALHDAGLSPDLLCLEITETVMANETAETVQRLRELKALGVRVAIDDFGTGYSSLSYLRSFPIDTVKIAKGFVDGLVSGSADLALVRAIVSLAHSLGITTVAEGVELDAQARRLGSIGCDQAQGFCFGRPVDGAVATELVSGKTTISFWVNHSGHELDVIKSVVIDFEERNPGLKVNVVGGMDSERIVAALRASEVPSAVLAFAPGDFGSYSTPDGMTDLTPYMERDGTDAGAFTDATQSSTQFEGRRWALPVLANAFGVYGNAALLAETGVADAPRTIELLTEQAKRLTRRARDQSLAIVGFNPLLGFYENSLVTFGHMFDARWVDDEGRSCFSRDPAWATMFRWQKSLVDWYGIDSLIRFKEGVGDEFSPWNGFQSGRLAMVLDGEWRMAFVAGQAPTLDYTVWPLPVDDIASGRYGSGPVSGSIVGIPSGAGKKPEAWRLVRYLATDEAALEKLGRGMSNLPSTRAGLARARRAADGALETFLDIYAHPKSRPLPIEAGNVKTQDLVASFAERWQVGQIPDLVDGLRDLDRTIDAASRSRASLLPPSVAGSSRVRSLGSALAEGIGI